MAGKGLTTPPLGEVAVHLARRGKDVLDAPADEAGAARTALTSGIAAESIIDVMESCLKAGVGRAITDRCGHRSPAKSNLIVKQRSTRAKFQTM